MLFRLVLACAVIAGAGPSLFAQSAEPGTHAAVWRGLAERLPPSARVKLRLRGGERFTATLVDAQPDGLLVEPKTRLPVPVQRIAYADIASMELVQEGGSVGKAIAIGVASGAGAFLTLLMIALSAWD
jgi:hypothetical protein